MSDLTDDFEFTPTGTPDGITATGDWHGDENVQVNAFYSGGEKDKAVEVLETLYRSWRAWRASLIEAIEDAHGDPGDVWIEAIHGYDASDAQGYFEIEFSAPDLFGDDLAMAVGTIGHGFDEVGIPG